MRVSEMVPHAESYPFVRLGHRPFLLNHVPHVFPLLVMCYICIVSPSPRSSFFWEKTGLSNTCSIYFLLHAQLVVEVDDTVTLAKSGNIF